MKIGFALTGSFCTFSQAFPIMEQLAGAHRVVPIFSEHSAAMDTRFGRAADHLARAEHICGQQVIQTIGQAEPIGPTKLLDVLLIAPCTGNTLAKLASGIADTSVTMAAKSHLRNGRPVVIAVSTNDGLGAAAQNIGRLLVRKHIYFVPFRQDDAFGKPTSLVADFGRVRETLEEAIAGRQVQPVLADHPAKDS